MILTITLNPLLERRLIFNSILLGGNNRANAERFTAGGKGINVSRQLNHLGIKNLAFTFLGGNNGKIFRHLLNEDKIEFTSINTRNDTREASLILETESGRLTTYFGRNSIVTAEEAEEFKKKMLKMIENCEIVVFSGSSPGETTDDIYPIGIETANRFDKISVCDTYGRHLKNCIDAGPTVLHNNISELTGSLMKEFPDEASILEMLHELYASNIKQAFITDGAKPVYAGNFDFLYKAYPPIVKEIDGTGSGDAFMAGIIYGLHHSHTFEQYLQLGLSLGAANAASAESCTVLPEHIEKYKPYCRIETVGKKIIQASGAK